MDAVVEFLHRLPSDVRRVGGSLPWRIALLILALLLNVGFYLPSLPTGTPGVGVPGLDKAVHLVVFALTVWAAGRLLAPRARFPMGWIVIAALIHTVVIELVQGLLPERGVELADVLFGVGGIAMGLLLWIVERASRRRAGYEDELLDDDMLPDELDDELAEDEMGEDVHAGRLPGRS